MKCTCRHVAYTASSCAAIDGANGCVPPLSSLRTTMDAHCSAASCRYADIQLRSAALSKTESPLKENELSQIFTVSLDKLQQISSVFRAMTEVAQAGRPIDIDDDNTSVIDMEEGAFVLGTLLALTDDDIDKQPILDNFTPVQLRSIWHAGDKFSMPTMQNLVETVMRCRARAPFDGLPLMVEVSGIISASTA